MDLAVSLPKIESLISSYLSGKKKVALLDKYMNLSNRVADAKFYLAVVREFSSGKSTFIQEKNLKYIAETRTKNELFLCINDMDED